MEYQYHQYSDPKIAALETWQLFLYIYKGRFDQPDFQLHSQMQSLLLQSRNELLYQENYPKLCHHPPPKRCCFM